MATWMSLASLSRAHLWTSVCGPEKFQCPFLEGWFCLSVIFRLYSSPSLPYPPLLEFGPHMSFISILHELRGICHHGLWQISQAQFYCGPGGVWGGRGSAHHLLTVTVRSRSLRGCHFCHCWSPVTTLVISGDCTVLGATDELKISLNLSVCAGCCVPR